MTSYESFIRHHAERATDLRHVADLRATLHAADRRRRSLRARVARLLRGAAERIDPVRRPRPGAQRRSHAA